MSENIKTEQPESKEEKKGMKKAVKITLLILSILFFLGAIITPIVIFAGPFGKDNYTEESYGDFIYRYDVSADVYDIVRYIGDDTVVVVPGKHKDKNVRAILSGAFDAEKRDFNREITKVTIENGIVSIGATTFQGCENLVDLDIPVSVQSVGARAFAGSGLRQLSIKDASVLKFADAALEGADYLTRLVIEGASSPLASGTLGSVSDNVTDLEVKQGVEVGQGSFDNLDSITNLYVYNYADLVVDRTALVDTNITTLNIYWVEDELTEEFMTKFSALGTTLRTINLDQRIKAIKPRALLAFTGLTALNMADGTAIDISSIPQNNYNLLKVNMTSEAGKENEQTLNITNDSGSAIYSTIREDFTNVFSASTITRLLLSENFVIIDNNAFRSFSRLNYLNFGENSKVVAIGRSAFGSSESVRDRLDVYGPVAVEPGSGEDSIVYQTFNYATGDYALRRTYNGERALGSYLVQIDFGEGTGDEFPENGAIDSVYKQPINIPVGRKILDYLPEDKPGHRLAKGFTLEGYYMPNGDKVANQVMEVSMGAGLTLKAKWIYGEHISYDIEYYIENLTYSSENDRYQLYEQIHDLVPVHTQVTIDTEREILGFTFDPNANGNILTTQVVANPVSGQNILRAYYKRNIYQLKFDLDYNPETSVTIPTISNEEWTRVEGTTDGEDRYIAIKYGATISALPQPTRQGYTFLGWYLDRAGDTKVDVNSAYEMTDNTTLVARWEAQKVKYTLDYYFEVLGSEESGEKTYARDGESHFVESTAVADTIFTYTIQPIVGFVYNEAMSNVGVRINGDGNTEIKIYFDREIYTISYDTNDQSGSTHAVVPEGESTEAKSLKYGATYILPQLTREGYTLDHWDTNANGNGVRVEVDSTVFVGSVSEKAQTLYAIWKPNTYNVVYNKNNNDAQGDMGSGTLTFDVTGNLEQNRFTLTGHHFTGWCTAATLTDGAQKFDEQETITINANNLASLVHEGTITLYALWEANTYTVHYYPGNEKATGSTTMSTMTYGVASPLSDNGFALTGHHFIGWKMKTGEDTYSELYTENQEVTSLTDAQNGNVDMYAQWEANKFNVAFDSNSDGNATGEMDTITDVTYGQTLTIPKNEFAYAGYEFQGWALEGDKTRVVYSYGGKETIETEGVLTEEDGKTVTLYAVWKAYTYTLTIHKNVEGDDTTQSVVWTYGTSTLDNTFDNPGYVFGGWATDKDKADKQEADFSTAADLNAWLIENGKENGATIELYTVWDAEDDTGYKVELYLEALVDGSKQTYYKSTTDHSVNKNGKTGTMLEFDDAGIRAIEGWNDLLVGYEYDLTMNGSDKVTGVINGRGTTVLKVYYKRVRTQITYDFNKGEGTGAISPSTLDGFEAVYGAPYLYNEDFPSLERQGYNFRGWATTAESKDPINSSDIYNGHNAEKTDKLYAIWEADENSYVVEYYLQNLNRDTNKESYVKAEGHGGTISGSLTDTLVSVTPDSITGFTLNTDNSDKYTDVKNVAEGLTIKLYYDRNQMTITFYSDGEQFGQPNTNYYYGQTVDLGVAASENPTKDYFTFDYWQNRANSEKMSNTFIITENLDLDAQFTETQYTIRINVNAENARLDSNLSQTYGFVGGQKVIIYTDNIDLVEISKMLTRTGYTIVGFDFESSPEEAAKYIVSGKESLSVTGQQLITDKGLSSPYASTTIELFAIWQINNYHITYSWNGNSVSHQEGESTDIEYNKEITLYDNAKTNFVYEGYTFTKWQNKNGHEETYDVGGSINMPAYDLELEPVWEAVSFVVRYEGNKPEATESSLNGNVGETQLRFGQEGTLAENSFSVNGYTFQRWAISKDGEGSTYAGNSSLSASDVAQLYKQAKDGYVTLYATWAPNHYSIVFHANDKAAEERTFSYTATYDQAYELRAEGSENFTRAGYKFLGWAESGEAHEPTYKLGDSLKNLKMAQGDSVDLYAVWEIDDGTPYKVEYYFETLEGGEYEQLPEYSADTFAGKPGDQVTATTKEFFGFVFDSEKTGSQNQGQIAYEGNTVLKVYYKRAEYTITFNENKVGSGTISGAHDEIKVKFGGKIETLPSLTRTGYQFDGWFTGRYDETQVNDGEELTADLITGETITLYAHWTATTSEYKVYYMLEKLDGTFDEQKGLGVVYQTFSGQTDTAIDIPSLIDQYEGSLEGFTYSYYRPTDLGLIDGDGNTEVWLYYTRNNYTLTLVVDGNQGFNSLSANISDYSGVHEDRLYLNVKYGATITLSFTLTPGYGNESFTYNEGVKIEKSGAAYTFTMPDQATIVTAKAEPNEYTVTFAANGGEVAGEHELTYKVKFNETLTGLNADVFTRQGYTLKGWAISEDAAQSGTITVGLGQTIDMSVVVAATEEYDTLEITLYAVWGADTYDITFDANYDGGQDSTLTFTYGEANKLAEALERTGYNFLGWDTDGGKTEEPTYTAGATVNDELYEAYISGDKSLTLYAIWQAKTYQVTFSANYGDSPSTSESTFTFDGKENVMASALNRTGYTFLGWSKNKGATTQTWTAGENVDNQLSATGEGPVTVYAVWKAHEFVVSYNSSDGDGVMIPSTFTYDQPNAVRNCQFSKDGYTFVGWSKTPGGQSIDIQPNAETKNDLYIYNGNGGGQPVTLYAVWQADTDIGYTIRHYLQDLSTNPNELKDTYTLLSERTETFVNGETGTEIDAFDVSTFYKTTAATLGYTYDEAKTGEGHKGVITADGHLTIDLYYTRNKYNVTYNNNGASYQSDNQYYVGYRLTLKTISEVNTLNGNDGFAKKGYTFANWTYGEGSTVRDGGQVEMPVGGLNLTANWTENTYTFVFNSEKGIGHIENMTGKYESEITLPDGKAFTYTGYTIKGWALTSGGEKKYELSEQLAVKDILDAVMEATPEFSGLTITLYAFYEPNPDTAYSVQHFLQNLDGNYPDSPSKTEPKHGTTGQSVTAEALSEFTGFEFDANKTGTENKGTISPNGDLVLKLYYARKSYDLTIVKQTGITSVSVVGATVKQDNVYSVKFGARVSVTATLETGYNFTGWFNGADISQGSGLTYVIESFGDGDLTLTAKAAAKEFDVTLEGNGGSLVSGKSDSDKTVHLTYDQAANLEQIYELTGHEFLGYGLSAQQKDKLYSGSLSESQVNELFAQSEDAKLTLYAIWKAETYTLTLEFEDGKGGKETHDVEYNTELPSVTPPTRTGYTFLGYYKMDGDSETQYYGANGLPVSRAEGGTKYTVAGDLTLKAKWDANKNIAYKIEYKLEDYDGDSYTSQFDNKNDGIAGQEKVINYKKFPGYYVLNETDTKTIDPEGNTTFIFTYKRQTADIHFDQNQPTEPGVDTTITGDAPADHTNVKYGAEGTLNKGTWAINEGWNLSGWFVNNKEGDVKVGLTATLSKVIEEASKLDEKNSKELDITLYADWQEGTANVTIKVYTQKLNENGQPQSELEDPQYYNVQDHITSHKAGEEWVLDEADFEAYIPVGSTATKTEYRVTVASDGSSVVEIYTKLKTVNIKFWQTDEKQDSAHDTINGYYGATLAQTVKDIKPTVTKTGHTFDCWMVGSDPITEQTINTSDFDLTVQWRENKYTVKYVGGVGARALTQTEFKKTYNETITIPSATSMFALTGRTLKEFKYGTENGQTASLSAELNVSDVATAFGVENTDGATLTFTAVWDTNTYTIKYHFNNENGEATADQTESLTYDTTNLATHNLLGAETFTIEGLILSGWKFAETAEIQKYAIGESVTINDLLSEANVTDTNGGTIDLYAHWISAEYDVTIEVEFDNGKLAVEGIDALLTKVAGQDVAHVKTDKVAYATYDYDTKKYTVNTITLTATTKDGYTFAGWYEKSGEESLESGTEYSLSMVTAAKTYVAKFSAVKVTLTLSVTEDDVEAATSWKNLSESGFEAGEGRTATKEVQYDTQLGTLPEPTRKGYSFAGWYNSTNQGRIDSSTTWQYTEEQTYTARWTANKYEFTFTSGGAVDVSGQDVVKTADYGQKVQTPGDVFTKTGFTLLGYSLTQGTSAEYSINTAYDVSEIAEKANKTEASSETIQIKLYAIFRVNTYNITFVGNGGKLNGQDSIVESNVEYTSTKKINEIIKSTTREGYEFNSFHLGEHSQPYALESQIGGLTTMDGDNITLTADWDIHSGYTLKVEAGDHGNAYVDVKGTETSKTPMRFDEAFTVRAVADGGYHFEGWYVVQEDGSESKLDSATETYSGRMPALEESTSTYTLKAKFEINTYTVNVVTVRRINKAVQHEAKVEASIQENGPYNFNASFTLVAPELTGYIATWYSDSDYSKVIGSEGSYSITDTKLQNNATVTIYAVYDAISYTINLKDNGGTLSLQDAHSSSFTAYYDTTYDLSDIVESITRVGYQFAGWKYNEHTYGTGHDDNILTNLTTNNGDEVNLEAQWTSNEYQVTFEAGEGADGNVDAKTIKYSDTDVNLSAEGFTKTGYTFAGWARKTGEEVGGIVIKATEINISGAEFVVKVGLVSPYSNANITLVAIWQANEIKVVLSAEDADNDAESWTNLSENNFTAEGKTANKTYHYDEVYGDLPVPSRTGYAFVGWFLAEGESKVKEDDKVQTIEETLNLTAHWEKGKYNVTITNYYKGADGMLKEGTTGGSAKASPELAEFESQVNLTATANSGYHFVGYFKDLSCTDPYFVEGNEKTSNSFTMGAGEVKLNALFEVDTYDVKVHAMYKGAASATTFTAVTEGTTGGTVSQGAKYKFGTEISLKATANPNYTFVGWYTDSSCTSPLDGVEDANATYTMPSLDKDGSTYDIYALFVINRVAVSVESYYQNAGDVAGQLTDLTQGEDNGYARLPEVLTNEDVTDEDTTTENATSGYILYGTSIEVVITNTKEGQITVTYHTDKTCTEGNKVDDGTINQTTTSLYVLFAPNKYEITSGVYTQAAQDKDTLSEAATKDESGKGGSIEGLVDVYYGQTITLTAKPTDHFEFDGWYKDSDLTEKYGTEETYKNLTLTIESVTESVEVYAKFVQKKYELKLHAMYIGITGPESVNDTPVSGTTGGNVQLPGKGEAGLEASYSYYAEQPIDIVANAAAGYEFTAWFTNADCTEGQSSENNISLTADTELWALFSPVKYALSVDTYYLDAQTTNTLKEQQLGPDGGTVTGAGSYYAGQEVTLTAKPTEGYELEGWYTTGLDGEQKVEGAEVSENTYTFSTSAAETKVVAKFVRKQVKLTVVTASRTADGNSEGTWKFSSDNATLTDAYKGGFGGIASALIEGTTAQHASASSVQTVYTGNVYYGKNVTFTVKDTQTGYFFAGWYNNADLSEQNRVGQNNTYTQNSVTEDVTIYAAFDQSKVTITLAGMVKTAESATQLISKPISFSDNQYGTISGQGDYYYGFEATLSATKVTGYHFVGWYTDATCTTPLLEEGNETASIEYAATETKTIYALFEADLYKIELSVRVKDGPDQPVVPDDDSGNEIYMQYSLSSDHDGEVQENKPSGYVYYGTHVQILNKIKSQVEYKFIGLYSDENGAHLVTTDKDGYLVTGANNNIQLYAIFEKQAYNVAVTTKYRSAETVNTLSEIKDDTTKLAGSVSSSTHEATDDDGKIFSVVQGKTITLKAVPTEHYVFKGWYVGNADCDGDATSTTEEYTFTITEATEIYARFDAKAYDVTVSALGQYLDNNELAEGYKTGVGGSVSIQEAKWSDEGNTGYFYGKDLTLSATPSVGYSFNAETDWTNQVDGSGSVTVASNKYNVQGEAQLYAKFTLNQYELKLKVRYYAASGIYGLGEPADGDTEIGTLTGAKKYYYGQKATINAAKGEGSIYTFAGWYSDAACQSQISALANYDELLLDTASPAWTGSEWVVYAKFVPDTLTYAASVRGQDADSANHLGELTDNIGGSISVDGQPDLGTTGNIYKGQEITFVAQPTKGYTFEGWFSDKQCSEGNKLTNGVEGQKITFTANDNIVVYAKFIPERYTLTTHVLVRDGVDGEVTTADGGVGGTISVDLEGFEGSKYFAEHTLTLTAAELEGYSFTGWYSDDQAQDSIVGGKVLSWTTASEDTDIYALFTKNAYTVRGHAYYQAADSATTYAEPVAGSVGGSVTSSVTVLHGATATLTATASANYVFIGWYNGSTFDEDHKITNSGDTLTGGTYTTAGITTSTDIYALFAIKKVAVTLENRLFAAKNATTLNDTYTVINSGSKAGEMFKNGTPLDMTVNGDGDNNGYVLYGTAPSISDGGYNDATLRDYKLSTGGAESAYIVNTALIADTNNIYAYYEQNKHTLKVEVYYQKAATATTLGETQPGTILGSITIGNTGYYYGASTETFNLLETLTSNPIRSTFVGFFDEIPTYGTSEALDNFVISTTDAENTIYALFIPVKFDVTLHTLTQTAASATAPGTLETDKTTGGTVTFSQAMFDAQGSIVSGSFTLGTTYYAYDGATVNATYSANTAQGYKADKWYSDAAHSQPIGATLSVTDTTVAYMYFYIRQITVEVVQYFAQATSPTELATAKQANTGGTITGANKYYYGFDNIQLTAATTNANYQFKGWYTSVDNVTKPSQSPVSSSLTYTVSTSVSGDKLTVYALFATATYRVTVTAATSAGKPTSWTGVSGWTAGTDTYYRDFYRIATGTITLPTPVVAGYVLGYWKIADGTRVPAEEETLPQYASEHSYANIVLTEAEMYVALNFTIDAITPGPDMIYNSSITPSGTATNALSKYSTLAASNQTVSGNSNDLTSITAKDITGYTVAGFRLIFGDNWTNSIFVEGKTLNIAQNLDTIKKMNTAGKTKIYVVYNPNMHTTTYTAYEYDGSAYAAASYSNLFSATNIVVTDAQKKTYTTTLANLVTLKGATITSAGKVTINSYYGYQYALTFTLKNANREIVGFNKNKTDTPTNATITGSSLTLTPYSSAGTEDNIQILVDGKTFTLTIDKNGTSLSATGPSQVKVGSTATITLTEARYGTKFKDYQGLAKTSSAAKADYTRTSAAAGATISVKITDDMVVGGKVTLYIIEKTVKVWVDAYSSTSASTTMSGDLFAPAYDTLEAAVSAVNSAGSVVKANFIIGDDITLSTQIAPTKQGMIISAANYLQGDEGEEDLPTITVSGKANISLSGNSDFNISSIVFTGTIVGDLISIAGSGHKNIDTLYLNSVVAESLIRIEGTGQIGLYAINVNGCTTGNNDDGGRGSIIYASGAMTISADTINVTGHKAKGAQMFYISQVTSAEFIDSHIGVYEETIAGEAIGSTFDGVFFIQDSTIEFTSDTNIYMPDQRDFYVAGEDSDITWNGNIIA